MKCSIFFLIFIVYNLLNLIQMKRKIILGMALIVAISMTACGSNEEKTDEQIEAEIDAMFDDLEETTNAAFDELKESTEENLDKIKDEAMVELEEQTQEIIEEKTEEVKTEIEQVLEK